MDGHKFTDWCFSGSTKIFGGKLSLYENNEGTLILNGDTFLLVEYVEYKKFLNKNQSKNYVCLWGTTSSILSNDVITIEGYENPRHLDDYITLNITVQIVYQEVVCQVLRQGISKSKASNVAQYEIS
ncbi:hypothetical protein [Candidatus Nitrosocosmicus sp. T]